MDEVNFPKNPSAGESLSPEQAMRLALFEGARGAGRVAPNPLVGCVIVDREHRFLSSGYHAVLGQDHAEAAALRKIDDKAKVAGGHVYVTLEPCAHQGRTPSCARALAPLKPASVTYAVDDPNPLVSGKGAEILREAGVVTQRLDQRTDLNPELSAELTAASEDLAEIFLHNQRSGLPFVAVKIASSLDGQMAFRSGESKWITGEAARLHVHSLRARYDAVAVGANTVMLDNPSLDVRHPDFSGLENRALIFDPQGRVVEGLVGKNLLKVRAPEKVFAVVARGERVSNPAKVTLLEATFKDGAFELADLLKSVKNAGITSFMIEGGAATIGAFFTVNAVQRLHLYQAPVLFGGRHALAWSSGFGAIDLANKFRFTRWSWQTIGDDLYWTGHV